MADADYSTEIWNAIPGYEGLYEASSFGRIKSLARDFEGVDRLGRRQRHVVRELILKQRRLTNSPYYTVCISKDGKYQNRYVHNLVCRAFHGPQPDGKESAHGDGNSLNNDPLNLRWATKLENAADRAKHGTQYRGKRSNTKLTANDVRNIREASKNGVKNVDLIALYNVNASSIVRIINKTNWAHI